jgi:hypothetical protein
MKASRIILLTMLFFAGISMLRAQTPTVTASPQGPDHGIPALGNTRVEKLAEAEANYLNGLKSDNPGLVESSLYYVLQLRIAYPDRKFPKLESAVDLLVAEGPTAGIRYKASLASTVFAAPRLIDPTRTAILTDNNDFFASIAEQLSNKLLVSKQINRNRIPEE